MMESLGKLLIDRNLSIASIESFTVGAFASRLGSVSGISKVYRGSAVTYQTAMKEKILGISHAKVEKYGVVSEEIAGDMAILGQKLFESDICISFTGNSGPLPMEDKPVGLCFVGLKIKEKLNVYMLHLQGNRDEIKNQAIDFGEKLILEKIKEMEEE